MATAEETRTREAEIEERRQLRPYRRLVGMIFSLAIVGASAVILRGIVHHLDRMPSADAYSKPKVVDVRALRACAEDLDRLETHVRTAAGALLSAAVSEPPVDFESTLRPMEIEQAIIVARCRLNEPDRDPAHLELANAASEVESEIRTYALLYSRYIESSAVRAQAARSAIHRAVALLNAR